MTDHYIILDSLDTPLRGPLVRSAHKTDLPI